MPSGRKPGSFFAKCLEKMPHENSLSWSDKFFKNLSSHSFYLSCPFGKEIATITIPFYNKDSTKRAAYEFLFVWPPNMKQSVSQIQVYRMIQVLKAR